VEISDYLRIIRRRLWILALVPLLSGGIVAALVLKAPPTYRATATVAAPALVGGPASNQYSGSNGPKAFVANFAAAVTSSRILNQVAAETHVPEPEVAGGLMASPIGDSSLIEVSYQTTTRPEAGLIAKAAAADTIRFLFQSQVTLAEQNVHETAKAVADAETKLSAFYQSTGIVLPDKAYEIKAQQLANLQQQQAQSQAEGQLGAAEALAATVKAKQAELQALGPKVVAYQSLLDRKQQATSQLDLMQQGLDQARAQYSAADPAAVLTLGETSRSPLLAVLARKGLPAAGAGLFLAVGMVLVLELLGRRPEPEAATDAGAEAAPVRPQAAPKLTRPATPLAEVEARPQLEARPPHRGTDATPSGGKLAADPPARRP
jgi:capsular polysaccharide biosynthesis protein